MSDIFKPSGKILKKYSDVLVNFALNSGKGIKKGEVVMLQVFESAKPILKHLIKSVLKSGAIPLIQFIPEGVDRTFLENANDTQLKYHPKKYLLERVNECDHFLVVGAQSDKHELECIDSKKIMLRQKSSKFYKDARNKKEKEGNLTWTYGIYGTNAMAKEVGMSQKEYWNQIIKACFLDFSNPISKWKEVYRMINDIKNKLNKLEIEKVHIKGKNVDLHIKIGRKRKWVGGSGRNIPSFEVYTSPDWRSTDGWIKFNQPLYRYGNKIDGIEVEFKKGVVVKVKASKNAKILKDMIKLENADRIGEFSLTDKRLSRITKVMGETLYDENIGGKYGNFHIALGSAFSDCFNGDQKRVKKSYLKRIGFNINCVVHTDIISTDDRIVKAKLRNGNEMILYKEGQFQI